MNNSEDKYCPFKDGELVFVRDVWDEDWMLRYSNGKMTKDGKFLTYARQQKEGEAVEWDLAVSAAHVTLPTI